MSSISLHLSTNSTLEAQNPRRDTGIPTVSAGLGLGGYSDYRLPTICWTSILHGFMSSKFVLLSLPDVAYG